MKILMAGSSGMVGTVLKKELLKEGHSISSLVRKETENRDEIFWNPLKGDIDTSAFEGCDGVINLAGASIFGRWTPKKKEIVDSRVQTTELLAKTIASLKNPPKIFINASATSYLGSETDEEAPPAGNGFLARTCQSWEESMKAAQECTRCVVMRFGAILSTGGGALKMMLPPFKFGLGGRLGSGEQYMSWIDIDDVVGAVHHFLECETSRGSYNLVSPNPVTNQNFTDALGKKLRRPTIMAVPEFAVRLCFGALADELLLHSAQIVPAKLLKEGYRFKYPHIEEALAHLLA